MCVFVPCVLCASRSPGATEKSTHREDELYIESAPLAEILSKCANFARRIPKHLHRLVNSPRDFPPNSYTILKRLFAFTMRFPPTFLYNVTFQNDFYNFSAKLHVWHRAICVHRFSHRFHSKADLFSHNFPRLTQNICASRPHTVPTFPRDFPQKICTLLHANSMCDSPRLCEELRHAFIHRVTCGTESALRCSTCLLLSQSLF